MKFRDSYFFLSNFYPCSVTVNLYGRAYTFLNAEAAFQASKCKHESDIPAFLHLDGPNAKKLGKTVALRDNWDDKRIRAMTIAVAAKFRQHPELEKKLLDITCVIEEENCHGDTFWGIYNRKGENNLGEILMSYQRTYHVSNLTGKVLCFTGRRPKDLYGYTKSNYYPLIDSMKLLILEYIRNGYTTFISGGAQGVDQLAFWAVNRIKVEHFGEFQDNIENIVYVPFYGQDSIWMADGLFGQKEYQLMLNMATKVLYLAWDKNRINEITSIYPNLKPMEITRFRDLYAAERIEIEIPVNGKIRKLLIKSSMNQFYFATVNTKEMKEVSAALTDRNRYMVDDSQSVLGVHDNSGCLTKALKGGTVNCLRYANSMDKEITVLSHKTLEILPIDNY